ncbi:acetoacetate decarboxylase [Bartonella callosciuri]|uniref:Acetoacetate decarboxylase n=1 Tax=Bartonella callosciuri TaxID=686223 RepID=A0A840P2H0_9HYPH|nr:acetoacetate decarboxylase [Bartonella callosciuri]
MNTIEDELRRNFLEQLRAQFENLPAGAYHLDETNINYLQTDKGALYALIPTILETKNRIVEYKTLAIFDKTQWYLIYGSQKTVKNPVFLDIYSDFYKLHLPKK